MKSKMYICIVETKKKIALLILDGLGYGLHDRSNAVLAAQTPYLDYLLETYPNARLEASGEAVGLPAGQMGNSEVGHMNLGAGRIVYQELGRIHKAVSEKYFEIDPTLTAAFQYAKEFSKKVHFIGLLSDGGVHAHTYHLRGLCEAAAAHGLEKGNVFIHGFLDGRDTDPQSGLDYVQSLESFLEGNVAQLATLIGRYYAMDRDNRWERIKKAYDLLVRGQGESTTNFAGSIAKSYQEGVTDEFMMPLVYTGADGQPLSKIEPGDVVICYNFRTDRGREITTALSQQAFPDYQMMPLPLRFITMTTYDETFQSVEVIFKKDNLNLTLGEVLADYNKTQTRIAETEKYPHVTFFFSGGQETPFAGEHRIMIPSPKVATYDLMPEMSAQGITTAICEDILTRQPDFICLNFANPDMVGHTGVFEAVVKAVETVDQCTQQVVNFGLEHHYSFIILADHGNAEFMVNGDGSVNTAHTTNLVPVIIIDPEVKKIKDGKLGDIAPTVLDLLNIPKPQAMSGDSLIDSTLEISSK
jgi:2,3-bisphosphoglycerate-independent phosphoglycerate mutase